MLSFIPRRRSDHPLDDKAARRALLHNIANMKPLVVLGDLSAHLKALKTTENLSAPGAMEIIAFIEGVAEGAQQALTALYIGPAQSTDAYQTLIWNTVYTYWGHLADAHRLCLSKTQLSASGLKPHMARTICRALRARSAQIKWALFRHGPVNSEPWWELGELYGLAARPNLARTTVSLGPSRKSSVEREFLCAAVLAASSPDALTAAQIEVADRVIARTAPHFRLSRQPAPGCFYVADLAGRHPPGRYSSERPIDEDMRCFGPADAVAEISRMIEQLERDQVASTDLIGIEIDADVLHTTLLHLLRYWSAVPQERKQRRRHHTERVSVVHGYEDVVANVGGLFLESPFVSNEEEWLLENASEGGFGAVLSGAEGQWLALGSLIGLCREEGTAFGAGVVRRIVLDKDKNRHLGIEMLAAGGTAVTISPASTDASDSPMPSQPELCVLMAAGEANSGEITLMMRPSVFSQSQSVVMEAYDRRYRLSPLKLIDRGQEFDLARYRILEEDRRAT
jgi:hypothetical protein